MCERTTRTIEMLLVSAPSVGGGYADVTTDGHMEVSKATAANQNASEDLQPTLSKFSIKVAGCGFLMGAADIVPGVSGGTVALILGVYERLLTAISRCDLELLRLLMACRFRAASERVDLKFVVSLGAGIACGIAGLASLMNHLLQNHMAATFAAFSGMILASSLLVARRVPKWQTLHTGTLLVGVSVALAIVNLPALKNPPDALWYLFLCGTIGITAMILPGISGAFILLLLGRYHQITGHIKDIVHGDISASVLLALIVFASGCVVGLLAFSRILKALLARHHDATMAMLCGFMIGSLHKLWPFQKDLTPDERFKFKEFKHYLPEPSGQVGLAALMCVAGFVLVVGLDAVSRRGGSD